MTGPIAPCGTDFIRAVGDQAAATSQAASAELVPSLRGAAGCLEGWNSNKTLTLKRCSHFSHSMWRTLHSCIHSGIRSTPQVNDSFRGNANAFEGLG